MDAEFPELFGDSSSVSRDDYLVESVGHCMMAADSAAKAGQRMLQYLAEMALLEAQCALNALAGSDLRH